MRILGLLLVGLCALAAAAEVSIISVTDETKHTRKEDFYHTFEYFIKPDVPAQGSKCQATRIARRWFVTAAHCVSTACQQGCTLQMDLLEGPVSAVATVHHTTKNPIVFVHPQYQENQNFKIPYDLALIRLDVNRAPKMYYRRATQKGQPHRGMSEQTFNAFLEKNRRTKSAYRHALSPSLPPLAVFDNANYVLERNISVISIFDGIRSIKQNKYPVYYVKKLGNAYTTNFGIRKGMSGSGVMTNTGELIGIISASVETDLLRGNQKLKHENWFMFPVFNENLIRFMRDTMGADFIQVDQKDAFPYLAQKTRKDFSALTGLMQK